MFSGLGARIWVKNQSFGLIFAAVMMPWWSQVRFGRFQGRKSRWIGEFGGSDRKFSGSASCRRPTRTGNLGELIPSKNCKTGKYFLQHTFGDERSSLVGGTLAKLQVAGEVDFAAHFWGDEQKYVRGKGRKILHHRELQNLPPFVCTLADFHRRKGGRFCSTESCKIYLPFSGVST